MVKQGPKGSLVAKGQRPEFYSTRMGPQISGHGSSTTSKHPPLTLLRLPTDIVRSICDFLPLAALLVFRLQTSPRLRNDDALGPLRIGRRGHELSFAEWQEAAEELRRLGLVRADHETSDDEDNGNDGQGERGQRSTKPSQRLPSVPSVAPSQLSTANPARPFRSVDVEPSLGWHGAASLAPKAYKLEVALGVMMATGPAYEARLFRRVIAFLGLISPLNALPPKRAARIDRKKPPKLTTPLPDHVGRSALSLHSSEAGLRTIVAISWNGISGEALLHLLRTEETFANVSLIIKTDRFDGEAWKEYRVGRRQGHATLSSGKAELDQDAEEESDDAKAPLPYVEAQMMVDVGSRAAKHVNIKGRGFSAGYRSF